MSEVLREAQAQVVEAVVAELRAGLVAAGGVEGDGLGLLGAGFEDHAGAAGGAGVGLQRGEHAAGQAQTACFGGDVHPLDLGVAVQVALVVGVLAAPAARGKGSAVRVVGDQVQAPRWQEVCRVHVGGVAVVAVADAVLGLYLVVQLDGVGVIEGHGADNHALHRTSMHDFLRDGRDRGRPESRRPGPRASGVICAESGPRPRYGYRARVLTVTSVNVNGLRAAAKKGFVEWLAGTSADVVCLQEVRAEPEQLPEGVRQPEGWHVVHAPAAAKGRAGVSLYSRREPDRVRIGFGSAEFDGSGRYVEADLPGVTVASLYLPSGEVGTERQDEKVRFMGEFLPYLKELRERAAADGREVVVCGDWNIAHRQADLKNWRANQKNSGFLPEERAWLGQVLDAGDGGYVDVVRDLHPEVEGPYTWWSYRGRAFDNDSGWRIDYQVSTAGLAAKAVKGFVERAATHAERWSDHAPVTVVYDL
ncbi:exodeoxyribonuclease III [Streptomyces bottropensis ATCC 25435]|uniref:Exodeoxyribonuclease III n=1 Tax=Streptomyces bottropensis ATCC 25435 TaxID=1054862 RepID=M3EPB2_9ACTN|nr:exodeoxyribonuclease III [Streptomyces bottropensis ATCC 25435]